MKKLFFTILLISFLAWGTGYCLFNHYIFHYPLNNEDKTDAVIVLTGGRNRITEAAKLLQSGLADKMFITGVDKHSSLQDISKINDIDFSPHKKVFIGKKALDTIGNAIEATEWMQENHITSIRLVTSNYHMPRSLEEFRILNPNLVIVPHPVYSDKVSKKWWKKWQSGKFTAAEYNKFLYVYLRNLLTKD